MIVNILITSLILILWYSTLKIDNPIQRKHHENICICIVCAVFILLAALRGSIGDTGQYIHNYQMIKDSSFDKVIEDNYGIGTGYYWFSKLFSLTGLPVQWWFGVVEAFFLVCIYSFINKFSTDRLFSLLCFYCMGLYIFSLAGLKQTMSMGFCCLAFIAFVDKKYIKFSIFALLAYWCHTAGLTFAFGLVVYCFRKSKFFFPIMVVLFLIAVIWGSDIWQYLIQSLENEHYAMYAEADEIYTAWTLAFYGLLFFLLLLERSALVQIDFTEANYMYGMVILVVAFQSLATSYSTAFRVAYYFLPFFLS